MATAETADRIGLSSRPQIWLQAAAVGIAGALPSLAWAFSNPSLLMDDLGHMGRLRRLGAVDAVVDWSFVHPARPMLGPYHFVTYELIGDRPVVHALLMAAINAAAVIALLAAGRMVFSTRVAFLAALFFAVVPNRASTRLWFPTGNYVLAIMLVLIGIALLIRDGRVARSLALFVPAILLFEGVIGLAAGAVCLWASCALRRRMRRAGQLLIPIAIAGLLVYVLSPKRNGSGTTPADSLDTIGHGLFGAGLWGNEALGALSILLVSAILAIAAIPLLPSFRRFRPQTTSLRIGVGLLGATIAPFVVAGVIFGARGIFDRSNAVPLVAVVVLMAATIDLVWHRSPPLALGISVLSLMVFAGSNLNDLRDYRAAAADGRALVHTTAAAAGISGPPLVVAPSPDRDAGIVAFLDGTDATTAFRLRYGDDSRIVLTPRSRAECNAFIEMHPDAVGLYWENSELVEAESLCAALPQRRT